MKKDILSNLDQQSLAYAQAIGRMAHEHGVIAYLVGGPVRDLYLKRPVKDLDIACAGHVKDLAESFAHDYQGKVTYYAAFKTASIVLPNGAVIDLSTCRREHYPHLGALPVVTPAGIIDDLYRRDFTINAMALVISPSHWGQLVDPTNGMHDLKAKRIRVLHEASFVEDPTRILRAVRFEQRLHFKCTSHTVQLLQGAVAKKMPQQVKPQRYFSEFKKILNEPRVMDCVRRLVHLGALYVHALTIEGNGRVLKRLAAIRQSASLYSKKGFGPIDVWLSALMAMQNESRAGDLAFALGQLGMNRQDKEKVIASLLFPKVLGKLATSSIKPSGVYAILKGQSLETLVFFRSCAVDRARAKIDKYMAQYRHVALSINGVDAKRLGYQGAAIKRVLEDILYQKLDGHIKTAREEIQLAKRLIA